MLCLNLLQGSQLICVCCHLMHTLITKVNSILIGERCVKKKKEKKEGCLNLLTNCGHNLYNIQNFLKRSHFSILITKKNGRKKKSFRFYSCP